MTASIEKLSLIAVDWGTSNLRVFLLDRIGNILETRVAKQGLLHVPNGDFAAALKAQISDILQHNPNIPIVMSGMVGSRQGWQEVPYLTCPLSLDALAAGLQSVKNQSHIWIIPGLRIDHPDGRVDVMRGEETQVLGSLNLEIQTPQIFCLPGTHCKWVCVEAGKLMRFETFMTGEVFDLLFKHSILGKSVQQTQLHMDAFSQGLEWAQRPEHLLSQLFQVRTQMLAGNLTDKSVHDFLSGMLIGHEVSAMLKSNTANINSTQKIQIIANSHIAQLYVEALAKHQLLTIEMDVDRVTALGIFKIAHQAGLVL